jgi:hypothetical protein
MPLTSHQIALRYAAGDLVLDRARIHAEEETYDLSSDRPPFSETSFSEGTGNPNPTEIELDVRLQGADLNEADQLLAQLEEAAANATHLIRPGDDATEYRAREVAGLTGEMTSTPTLRGYRVQFRLAATSLDWEAFAGPLVPL